MTSEEVIAQLWKWPFHSGTSRWSLAWLDEDNLHISIQNVGMPGDMRFSYALNEPPHFSTPNFRVVWNIHLSLLSEVLTLEIGPPGRWNQLTDITVLLGTQTQFLNNFILTWPHFWGPPSQCASRVLFETSLCHFFPLSKAIWSLVLSCLDYYSHFKRHSVRTMAQASISLQMLIFFNVLNCPPSHVPYPVVLPPPFLL